MTVEMMRQERDARIRGLFKAQRPFPEIMEDFDLSFEETERIFDEWMRENKARGIRDRMEKVGPNEYRDRKE